METFITRFKGSLWSYCLDNHIFDNIPSSNFKDAQKIIDDAVSNYKTQIMQNDNDANLLFPKIINEIRPLLDRMKLVTNDSIKNDRKETFDKTLEEKQNEFNEMMKINKPKQIDFNDGEKDEPLSNDNLEELLNKQLKEREDLGVQPIINSPTPKESNNVKIAQKELKEENIIVSSNQFNDSLDNENNVIDNATTFDINQNQNLNNNEIMEKLNEMYTMQKMQMNIMNKLIKSQIKILEKLK